MQLMNGNPLYEMHDASTCRRANGHDSFSVIRMPVQERPVMVANPTNFHLSELRASLLIQIAASQGNTMKMFIEICILYNCIINEHSYLFAKSEMEQTLNQNQILSLTLRECRWETPLF